MRRSYLSILVLVATLVSIVVTPAVTSADGDKGNSKQNQKQQKKNDDKHNDKHQGKHHDKDDDDFETATFQTVGVCHFTGSERGAVLVFIRIPEEAIAAHQAHGDVVGVTSSSACVQQTAAVTSSTGTINVGDAVCREGEACVFTVWQSRGTGSATVTYTTENDTATGGAACGTSGVDYVSTTGTVSVGAASTTTLSVQTCTDNLTGPDERFRVKLTGTSSGRINDNAGKGILLETSLAVNGGQTTIVQSDASGSALITWGSTGGTAHRVYYAQIPSGTPQGTLCTVGTQFQTFPSTSPSGILIGLQANSAYCIQVRRVEVSGTETILTTTTGPITSGATVSIGNATVCTEGALCSFPVTLTGGTTPITVTYSTMNGTAFGGACNTAPPADFQQTTSGQITVQPNVPTSITVQACVDLDPLGSSETFSVILVSAPGATIIQPTGVATITGS